MRPPRWLLAAAWLTVAAIAACGGPNGPGNDGAPPQTAAETGATNGGADTSSNEQAYGRCWLSEDGFAVYSACRSDTRFCLIDRMNGTWGVCAPPCETDTDCMIDDLAGSCLALNADDSVCFLLCMEETDCPSGMLCQQSGSSRACVHELG